MAIELNEFEEASAIIDVLIGKSFIDLYHLHFETPSLKLLLY